MGEIKNFPTIKVENKPNSHNNTFSVQVGSQHPHPAAVTVQEVYEFWHRWKRYNWWAFAALIAGIVLMITVTPYAIIPGLGLFAAGVFLGGLPAAKRELEFRGQTLEIVFAHKFYGRSLEDEIWAAAHQLSQGYEQFYKHGWTHDKIAEEIRSKWISWAEKEVPNQMKLFTKAWKYFHPEKEMI